MINIFSLTTLIVRVRLHSLYKFPAYLIGITAPPPQLLYSFMRIRIHGFCSYNTTVAAALAPGTCLLLVKVGVFLSVSSEHLLTRERVWVAR
jgi:hypothetical protein